MRYETFITPSEKPPSLLSVKRALLSYDKVFLNSPNDRDLFPDNLWYPAIMGNALFAFPTGPIRPLGKTPNYDQTFDELVTHLQPAIAQEILDIRSIYTQPVDRATIGGYDAGGYPLNPSFVLDLYRIAATNKELMQSAIANITQEFSSTEELTEIAVTDALADSGINGPPLEDLTCPLTDESNRIPLTHIARARLATIVKVMGYCQAKDMVPYFENNFYRDILNQYRMTSRALLDNFEPDDFWNLQARASQLLYEEQFSNDILEKMSTEDVLKMRTSLWGKHAEKREDLFRIVRALSLEHAKKDDFEESVKAHLLTFKASCEELKKAQNNLRLNVLCDFAGAISKGTWGGIASSLLAVPFASTGFFLMAGAMATPALLDIFKTYPEALDNWRNQEENLRRNACYGLQEIFR